MSAQDVTMLVGAFGFPIFLILSLMVFVDRRVWPWWIKYAAERGLAEDKRHESFIAQVSLTREAQENIVATLHETSKTLVMILERLESHGDRLEIIQAAMTGRDPLRKAAPR